jgi:sulfite exporter TauE/SafE
MPGLALFPVFLAGLLGGVHCIGMCGGIVGAFSAASPRRAFPVAVTMQRSSAAMPMTGSATFMLAYNAGRISSYATAGAIAGGLADGARRLAGLSEMQEGGYWLANLMLIAVGLHLMHIWGGVARLESAGQLLWRHVQPLTRHVLPAATPARALMLGALWGWLPCGMVYSMLTAALMSGSAASGAAEMTAFGLGTLPALLALGMLGHRVRGWSQQRAVRTAGGATIAAFGMLGIYRALHGLPQVWSGLCLGAA